MKNIMKKAISVLIVTCLAFSLVMLVACNKNDDEGKNNSSSNVATSSSAQPPKLEDIKFEDRTTYNAQAIMDGYLDCTVYDVMYSPEANTDILKGYLVGDIYNMLIDALAEQLQANPNLSKLNIDILYFKRDTKGDWRNYNKAEVHPIIGKFLNYRLDGSEELSLTSTELKTYGDIKLYSLYRESLSKTKVVFEGVTVSEGNKALTNTINQVFDELFAIASVPVLSETLNATVSEISTLLAGTSEEQSQTFEKIYGNIKLGDIAAMFTANIPTEFYDLPLSAVLNELTLIAEVGVDAYFVTQIEQMLQFTMGDIMLGFGIELPENLAAYTLGEVLAELKATNQPVPDTDETLGEEQTAGFLAELGEYIASSDIYVAEDGTVILSGEEFMGYVMYAMEIVSAVVDPTATTAQNIDAAITALDEFVIANDERFTAIVTAIEEDGYVIFLDETTTMLPSEAYALLKDFLAEGESYQEIMYSLTEVSLEEYLELNGIILTITGVEKIDDFMDYYKAMSIAELMDSSFVEEYAELQASLTLSERIILSGYGSLIETNKAMSSFMAKYGDLTEAELSLIQEDIEYLEDLMMLYKGITMRELLQTYIS